MNVTDMTPTRTRANQAVQTQRTTKRGLPMSEIYCVQSRQVWETCDGLSTEATPWEYRGHAFNVEDCFAQVIGPDYPKDYDGVTVFGPRIRIRRRDPENPGRHPWDEVAIFRGRIMPSGATRIGELVCHV